MVHSWPGSSSAQLESQTWQRCIAACLMIMCQSKARCYYIGSFTFPVLEGLVIFVCRLVTNSCLVSAVHATVLDKRHHEARQYYSTHSVSKNGGSIWSIEILKGKGCIIQYLEIVMFKTKHKFEHRGLLCFSIRQFKLPLSCIPNQKWKKDQLVRA